MSGVRLYRLLGLRIQNIGMGLRDALKGLFGGRPEEPSPFGVDAAQIYSSRTVDPKRSDLCEKALASNKFIYHGQFPDEQHAISYTCDGMTFVGMINVLHAAIGDALVVEAVYQVGPDGTQALLKKLRELYPSS